ncbi:MAG: hypothetical protein ABR905_01970 [Terracidiphilus sp.]|jgi:hypothetical protein
MMKTRWIPALMIVAMGWPGCFYSPCQAQGRYSLTPHRVAQTFTANGIETADEQVSLLANVVASEPAPVLDILSINPLGDRSPGKHRESRSLVKMGCREPGVCLPFYSIVSKLEPQENVAPNAPRVSSNATGAARGSNSGIVIRAGAHATLVMEDARAHVEVAVVSLENGAAGHKIRVATPDHKQVYLAEVVSANLLKRSF